MSSDLMNLINLIFKLGDWINTITNFHIVMNLAIIGWLFSAKKPWPALQRIIVIIGFAIFASYNIAAQHATHDWLQIALNQLKVAVAQDPKATTFTPEFRAMLQDNQVYNSWSITIGYIVVDLFMMALIWFSYLWKKDEDAVASK